ncbi:hypothetical protein FK220_002115 [Flavobacteriaceae bacterium TP-CH-4]|uniref:Lipoprotein n=1 Tax=Pelagihabitans pacificus TaxID=2696054 RepID=A0A967AQ24_9FLAO|nr:hypothetical protein [Pelagihabitans pacificus]NHF58119.1 hypothetical protein [Pelagihabitans pacificus]
MREYLFLLLIMCGLFVSCKEKSKTTNDPDPNKKNWYVYKQKNRPICPNPIWGPDIQNPQNYDLICGPLTKKEADECWEKNCNVDKIVLSEWDPQEDFYAVHIDNDCELTSSKDCARVKIVLNNHSSLDTVCDNYTTLKVIDLNKYYTPDDPIKFCGEEQDLSKYKVR